MRLRCNTGDMLEPDPEITCIDCGGRCFLLTRPPEDNLWEPGEIVAYRCEDCLDRWDVVLTDEDDEIRRGEY
jgi:DNA-directed RNA polymerase subunit RPC12/RpoP